MYQCRVLLPNHEEQILTRHPLIYPYSPWPLVSKRAMTQLSIPRLALFYRQGAEHINRE